MSRSRYYPGSRSDGGRLYPDFRADVPDGLLEWQECRDEYGERLIYGRPAAPPAGRRMKVSVKLLGRLLEQAYMSLTVCRHYWLPGAHRRWAGALLRVLRRLWASVGNEGPVMIGGVHHDGSTQFWVPFDNVAICNPGFTG